MNKRILIVEPFYSGSHRQWSDDLVRFSRHHIELLTLPGRLWKWRMHGGAVELAQQFLDLDTHYDVIVASDMLDLTTFLSLIRQKLVTTKVALYFHENQLTYPWSPSDQDVQLKRDRHYAWINYTSALAADQCWFNSKYHMSSFLDQLPSFLRAFPDYPTLDQLESIRKKGKVLHLGMKLQKFLDIPRVSQDYDVPVFLWNHRWEYDKNPDQFFDFLLRWKKKGGQFKLILLGQAHRDVPVIFHQVSELFAQELIHSGFVDKPEEYVHWLSVANVLLVTSIQDFFGGSVVEAIAAGCRPFVPDRLAYPEHIPAELAPSVLYDSIHQVMNHFTNDGWRLPLPQIMKLRSYISKYDWSGPLGKSYDAFLQLK